MLRRKELERVRESERERQDGDNNGSNGCEKWPHVHLHWALSDFLDDVNDWIRDSLSLIIISAEQRQSQAFQL